MYRTHTCGELRAKDEGKTVMLSGWIHSIRTHGAITFIDIKDRYGITQVTSDEKQEINKESVIQIEGKVVKKPEANKSLATGEIEIQATKIKILTKAEALPIDNNASDDMRLKYRYLDIRNNNVLENLKFRSKVTFAVREFFELSGFLEVETPFLVKSTPEGARDYIVPSRVSKNKFYALPQSPQLYKQILMIGGVDKYFQLARCLRDEDLRADRQPEHTQIDFEMSFVHAEDIRLFVEDLMKHTFKKSMNIELDDFPTFTHEESMSRFGTDKPDIRFGLELINITDIAKKTSFGIFKEAEYINAIYVGEEFSRKQIDAYTELVKIYKAKGLAFVKVNNKKFESGIAKFLEEKEQQAILESINCSGNGTIFFVADTKKICRTALGHLRVKLSQDLELLDPKEFKFCWVKDFPLFAYNEDGKRWEPEHHMFSMPTEEFIDSFEKQPEKAIGDLWDLTLNGWEMASGSIRVSDPVIQEKIMKFIGFSKEEAETKFGFLLEAYKYGGPVHGGMGVGLDRLVSLMLGFSDIREVIAFPKNKSAECPMDDCPSSISKTQLEELNITFK